MKKRCSPLLCALFLIMALVPEASAMKKWLLGGKPRTLMVVPSSDQHSPFIGAQLAGTINVIPDYLGTVTPRRPKPTSPQTSAPVIPNLTSTSIPIIVSQQQPIILTGDTMQKRTFQRAPSNPEKISKHHKNPQNPITSLHTASDSPNSNLSSPKVHSPGTQAKLDELFGKQWPPAQLTASPLGDSFSPGSPTKRSKTKTPSPKKSSPNISFSSSSRARTSTQSTVSPPTPTEASPLPSLDPLDQKFADIPTSQLINQFQNFWPPQPGVYTPNALNGNNVTTTITLGDYAQRIMTYGPSRAYKKKGMWYSTYGSRVEQQTAQNEMILQASAYMNRFIQNVAPISQYNAHRMVLASLSLADKVLNDHHFDNRFWAQTGGLGLAEFNAMEVEFFFAMGVRGLISPAEREIMRNAWLSTLCR